MRKRIFAALALVALGMTAGPVAARTILFVGNSFTYGHNSPVMRYHTERVTDLNGTGFGGVPALFKTFADECGLDWTVSIEADPGKDLAFHLAHHAAQFAKAWDVVLLQGHSVLDPDHPGDPARHIAAAQGIAEALVRANPKVTIRLVSTWSRADLTYRGPGPWQGKPIARMAEDIAAANVRALATIPAIGGAIPVGAAWNRAMVEGIADPDPYDGIAFGQIDLWTWDHFHASAYGYYLEALVDFGAVTGIDPRKLGREERAANDLGFDPQVVARLEAVAAQALGRT